MNDELLLEEDLASLWQRLRALHFRLREHTKAKYNRVNPFIEDLFDWKEKGTFVGGKNVTIYDSATIHGDVRIGDNTWIGPYCSIDGTGGLSIGSFCCISTGTRILTHDTVKWSLSGGHEPYEYGPVSIGDCCFIGVEAIILRGVTIGDHSLIAANSLVTKDIPGFSIAAGVPARVVGEVELRDGRVTLSYSR